MTSGQLKTVLSFEDSLKPGDAVYIRWTNCGNRWGALATVFRVNEKSIVATLNEELGGPMGYPIGQKIKAPRLTFGRSAERWSPANRVEPVNGY